MKENLDFLNYFQRFGAKKEKKRYIKRVPTFEPPKSLSSTHPSGKIEVELRGFWCGTEGCVELRGFKCGTEGGVLN